MRVLVTGASGYMGRHVMQQLHHAGCDVVLLGRNRPAGFEAVPLIHADLLAADDLSSAMKQAQASHLLHLAWYADYGKFWTSPLNFKWVEATLRLVGAFCEQGGQRVVIAGSCAEYDWFHGYLREEQTPRVPSTTYGVAKDATRRLTQALCAQHAVSFAWGHIFFPFGPGEARQRMIPSLIEVFQGKAAPFGVNASAYRGMLYVPDAAQAFVKLVQDGAQGSFNICSGQPVQIGHVVKVLAEICRADPEPVLKLASSRAADPPLLAGENLRLLATGWKPAWTLEQGLAAMVQGQG